MNSEYNANQKILKDACFHFFQLQLNPSDFTLDQVDPYWNLRATYIMSGIFHLFQEKLPTCMPQCLHTEDFWSFVEDNTKSTETPIESTETPIESTETNTKAMETKEITHKDNETSTLQDQSLNSKNEFKLIGLCGGMHHGKSTAASYLCSHYKYVEYAFADPLKNVVGCQVLFGLKDDQLWGNQKEVVDARWGVTPRYILQRIGTDLFRNHLTEYLPTLVHHNSIWIRNLERWFLFHPSRRVVISDVRFLDEAEFLRTNGAQLIEIFRPTIENDIQKKPNITQARLHISETSLEVLGPRHTIINNSTKENLFRKIDIMLKQ